MKKPNAFIQKTLRYFHTIKYLKPIQIYGQIKFRLHKPKVTPLTPPNLRPVLSPWTSPIPKSIPITANNHITFLNQTKDISSKLIWSDPEIDKLWLYNLHYFDVLQTPAADLVWQKDLMKRWIDNNPPAQGNGWEPYTISLRLVNLIKWELAGNSLQPIIRDSMATQIRYLNKRLEIHILGNHLLANIKALIFAGCFFVGPEADKWFNKGIKYFNREIKKQILADGGHIELTPMYQAIVLEDILDIMNVMKSYDKIIPANWQSACNQMFIWLRTLSHPDNDIAFFNDATLGVAPTLAELSAYRDRLQLAATPFTEQALTKLAASGYVRAQQNNCLLLVDVAAVGANHQPGHAHADSLSFEMSLGAQRIFVNSGTSTYATGCQRLKERGTYNHNTVIINDTNSSEVWQSFRVARRAKIRNLNVENNPDNICISAEHNGYYHAYKIIHARKWLLTKNKLVIEDHIKGAHIHKITLCFHLHPDIHVNQRDNKIVDLCNVQGKRLAILHASHAVVVRESTYHPGFNLAIPNKKIIIETAATLPTKFTTNITWSDDAHTVLN
jgi:uncharacterized heparinase superfamily protein